jgi:hypothetical protein
MESERIFYFLLQKKFQMEHNIALYSSADQTAPELLIILVPGSCNYHHVSIPTCKKNKGYMDFISYAEKYLPEL